MNKKLIVLGLDGASYTLIKEFSEEGIMPNFSKILKNGKCGVLKSTTPPHTAPGWVSSLTGVLPGDHGIYQFWDTQSSDYVGKFMGSRDVKYPFVWDVLNENGYSAGIINVPMSHPPKKINGYMFTWPLSNTLNYCYPKELIREIADNQGQYVSDLLMMFSGDENYIFEAIKITRKRVNTILYLLKHRPTDLMICVFTEIDRVSHYYWKYIDDVSAKESMRNAIQSIYRETDAALGKILDYCNDDFNFIIYSDHGFEKGVLDFYVQTFLINKGFMHIKKASANYVPDGSWFEYWKFDELYVVDWSRTVAYMSAPGSYGINLNLINRQSQGIVSESNYDKICNQIIDELIKIKNPLDNTSLFKKVCYRKEIYNGNCINGAPDIILIPQYYGIMAHHKLTDREMFCMQPEQNGMHSQEGIIILYGNEFEKVHNIPVSIEQVAPTILEFYNLKIPDYMERSFPKKQLVNDSTDMVDCYRKDEQDSIISRLKMLGYY